MKKITAEEGYKLLNENDQFIVTEIYLPDNADESVWQIVANEVAEAKQQQWDAEHEADMKARFEEYERIHTVPYFNYIEATKGQYTRTDYIPSENTKIRIEAYIPQFTSNSHHCLIGSENNDGNQNRFSIMDGCHSSSGGTGVRFDIGNKMSFYFSEGLRFNEKNVLEISKHGFYINDVKVGEPQEGWNTLVEGTSTLFNNPKPLYIFNTPYREGETSQYALSTKIFDIEISEENASGGYDTTMKLIPSYEDNGTSITYGFLDTLSLKMFKNVANDTNFTVGEE